MQIAFGGIFFIHHTLNLLFLLPELKVILTKSLETSVPSFQLWIFSGCQTHCQDLHNAPVGLLLVLLLHNLHNRINLHLSSGSFVSHYNWLMEILGKAAIARSPFTFCLLSLVLLLLLSETTRPSPL